MGLGRHVRCNRRHLGHEPHRRRLFQFSTACHVCQFVSSSAGMPFCASGRCLANLNTGQCWQPLGHKINPCNSKRPRAGWQMSRVQCSMHSMHSTRSYASQARCGQVPLPGEETCRVWGMCGTMWECGGCHLWNAWGTWECAGCHVWGVAAQHSVRRAHPCAPGRLPCACIRRVLHVHLPMLARPCVMLLAARLVSFNLWFVTSPV